MTEIGTYSTIYHYEHFFTLFPMIPDYVIKVLDCQDLKELELFSIKVMALKPQTTQDTGL